MKLTGTYKLSKTQEEPFKRLPVPDHLFQDDVDIVLPSDDARRITGVYGLIYRDKCSAKIFDRVNLDLPKDTSRTAEQSSVNGYFKAVYRAEGFHLERVGR